MNDFKNKSMSSSNFAVNRSSIVLTAIWPVLALIVLIHSWLLFRPVWELFPVLVVLVNTIILAAAVSYFYLIIRHRKKTQLKQNSQVYCWLCPQSVISWSIFQSASLLLIVFAKRFADESQKAFWIGLVGLAVIYLVSQAGFIWLNSRFRH